MLNQVRYLTLVLKTQITILDLKLTTMLEYHIKYKNLFAKRYKWNCPEKIFVIKKPQKLYHGHM